MFPSYGTRERKIGDIRRKEGRGKEIGREKEGRKKGGGRGGRRRLCKEREGGEGEERGKGEGERKEEGRRRRYV